MAQCSLLKIILSFIFVLANYGIGLQLIYLKRGCGCVFLALAILLFNLI